MTRQKQKERKMAPSNKKEVKVKKIDIKKGRTQGSTASRAINELKVLVQHLKKYGPGECSNVSISHDPFLDNQDLWICKISVTVDGVEHRTLGRGEKLSSKSDAAFEMLKVLLPSCATLDDMITSIRAMRSDAKQRTSKMSIPSIDSTK